MGNGMRMKKKNNLKRCLTMENEEFDEHIDLRNSIKHKTKKFSQFIIPDDTRRRTNLKMVSSPSPEDSSLSSLSQSAEEEEEENNEKSSSPKHAEGDDSPKKSQTGKESCISSSHDDSRSMKFEDALRNEKTDLDEFMNFDPLVARHYFFNNQYSTSHHNNEEKKNSEDVASFVSMMKNASPVLKKKIMISSDKPEYEKEEPNDEKRYKLQIIDYNKTQYKEDEEVFSSPKAGSLRKNPVKYYGCGVNDDKEELLELGISVICRKGSINDYPNQDDYFIFIDNHTRIYSVFDGHGPFGHIISALSFKILMKNLVDHPEFLTNPKSALKTVFLNINDQIKEILKETPQYKSKEIDTKFSGTTATILLQRSKYIYIAHLGDSRAIICKKLKKKEIAYQLTTDHVATLPSEKKRIYSSGGEVRRLNNDYVDRIFVRGRIYPALPVSRSIGDEVGSLIGITSQPEINLYEIGLSDQFILLGTKPVFSYLEEAEIVGLLGSFNGKGVRTAADYLYKRVKNAWVQNENGFDDITIILVYL